MFNLIINQIKNGNINGTILEEKWENLRGGKPGMSTKESCPFGQ